MKISADPNHPDFSPYAIQAEVFFNGKLARNVLHADDEANIITVPKYDAKGNILVIGENFLTEDKHGKVKIIIPGHYVTPKVPNET